MTKTHSLCFACFAIVLLFAFSAAISAAAEEIRPGVFRTPDERFENLKDYPFAPHYLEIDSKVGKLRMHYVDVGPRDADPVLLLHGEPSWSYLYRKMIPPLVAAGHRVIAPDLIGFGRSDKPAKRSDHSYPNHVDWMMQFVTELDLKNVTLFCQDWGSLIGLRVVAGAPDRFARVVAGNAALPAGPGDDGLIIGGQWNQPDPNAELKFEDGFHAVAEVQPNRAQVRLRRHPASCHRRLWLTKSSTEPVWPTRPGARYRSTWLEETTRWSSMNVMSSVSPPSTSF